ncbi:MAG TPA: TraM recognition domain-containing protein [Acidimicrobiales bacterium]|jgi:type IV secretory pathway TraG/TraD family ATPase VirD4|nr:TraM recognition domain-containing protein [Acidimicrobiales bacterium]
MAKVRSAPAVRLPAAPGVIIGDGRYSGYDQPMVIFGGTGAGKTTWSLRNIVRSPGPTVISSMKPELFAYTAGYFLDQGRPVWVFDADGVLDLDPEMVMHWSPITSCVVDTRPGRLPPTAEVARSRFGGFVLVDQAQKMADRLSFGAIPAGRDEGGWRAQTASVLTPMLVAAAIGGIDDARKLLTWAEGVNSVREALDILRLAGLPGLRSRLNTAFGPASSMGGANRSSYANLVNSALSGLANPYVAQMCMTSPEQSFDVGRFVKERGVLYLVGSSESQKVIATVVATMVEDIIERAKKIEKPLRPPLALWLDEVANTAPLPTLPELFSTGRGDGLYLSIVLQSYSQAEARWGKEGADTIHANAVVELHLAGSKDLSMLSWLERAGGQADVVTRSVSVGVDARTDTAGQSRQPVFDTRDLRGLAARYAWLVYGNQTPAMTHLAPWWECEEREVIERAWRQAHRWVPEELMPLPAPAPRKSFAWLKGLVATRARG